MKSLVGVLLLALFATMLPAQPALAQVGGAIVVDQSAAAIATDIVNGTIVSTTNVVLDGEPYLVSELDISETISGSQGATIFIEVPGGMLADGTTIVVSNQPRFSPEEQVQVALVATPEAEGRALASALRLDVDLFSVVGGLDGSAWFTPGISHADAVSDYVLLGIRWSDFAPAVPYKINPINSGAGVSSAATVGAVRRAFDAWEDDVDSTIDFTYAGTTSLTGIALGDGQNTVSWVNTPNPADVFVGETRFAVIGTQITGFDVQLNRDLKWADGNVANHFDIESVMIHEVGHVIGLGHVDELFDIMYAAIAPTEVIGITAGASLGARALYPAPDVAGSEPGHTVATNSDGSTTIAVLKRTGGLYITNPHQGAWLVATEVSSSGMTLAPDGVIHIAAISLDGTLRTAEWPLEGEISEWTSHGPGWDTDTRPSLGSSDSGVVMAAITTNGTLRTTTMAAAGSWDAFVDHGRAGWAHVDIDMAADGDIWYAAVKRDGRLYVRKHLGTRWSGFAKMGLATWSSATPPSIAANNTGVVFSAVKADGRLYTRRQTSGTWRGWTRQGLTDWASADVAMAETGEVWLVAVKRFGRLHVRERSLAGWRTWQTHGRDTWSRYSRPSMAIRDGSPVYVAVKASGTMYSRRILGGPWQAFRQHLAHHLWAPGY